MIPKKYNIERGGTLSVCQTEKFKAGMLSVSLVLPIERESVWKTSLLLSVLRRGTEKYPTLSAINQRLDYLYGTELSIRNFYRGDSQIIGFSADILGSAYLPDGEDLTAGVLDVMREILFHPLLDENGLLLERYVESEKKQQCDNIRSLKNNPRGYASEQCRALLYQNEPCGASVYGNIEDIMALTPAELTAHWRALIATVTPACFYVGADDAETLQNALNTTFLQDLAENPAECSQAFPSIVRCASEVRRAEEELPVGQSQLVIGLRTNAAIFDSAYYACAVFNELLGASPASKLFMNVRERLSLCYFCASNYNAYKGTILIHCGLERADRVRAEEEIFAQLRAITEGDFSDEELTAAKLSIVNAYRQIEDSPAALESFYFGRALIGVFDTTEDVRARFAAVTREEVITAAKQITTDVVYFLNGTLAGGEEDENEDD